MRKKVCTIVCDGMCRHVVRLYIDGYDGCGKDVR